jgi:hypothetical protein
MGNRKMVFVPAWNGASALFFFYKSDGSWSVRDYSVAGRPAVARYGNGRDFPEDLDKALARIDAPGARQRDVPAHPTDDHGYWHRLTVELNREWNLAAGPSVGGLRSAPAPVIRRTPSTGAGAAVQKHPMVDLEDFLAHPKVLRRGEMERILGSANSEDWVTWNVVRLLLRRADWWERLLGVIRARNTDHPDLGQGPATASVWDRCASPADYERASRERMSRSADPSTRARAANPKPVEGATELDVTFSTARCLVYVEAKLGSDLSSGTTYDPERNQLARVIDVAIENAGARRPAVWMFVRSLAPHHSYIQLVRRYRMDAGALARDLPHRDRDTLQAIARTLTIVPWTDFLPLLGPTPPDVMRELERRAQGT